MTFAEALSRVWKLTRYNRDWPLFLWSKVVPPPPDRLLTFRLRNGQVVTIRADVRFILNEIFRDGVYDVPGALLSDCKTILDVGANMGLFALHAADCSPNATIYCFEPSSASYSLLEQNIRRNRVNARLFKMAVAAEVGEAFLALTGTSAEYRLGSDTDAIGERVQCTDLRRTFELAGVERFDLVKIDIEGTERALFEHTSDDVLRRMSALVMEWHYRFDELQPIVHRLKSLGFEAYGEVLHGTRYLRAWQRRTVGTHVSSPC